MSNNNPNPTDEDWKRITKLVDVFYQRPDSEPFRDPVAWKELGLDDYPTVVQKPMDLGTIRDRLKKKNNAGQRYYKTLHQVAQDVRLVWTNCMSYNADGSDFFKLAESLQKRWEDRYAKLIKECSVGNASSSSANSSANRPQQQAAQQPGEDKKGSGGAGTLASTPVGGMVVPNTSGTGVSDTLGVTSDNNAAAGAGAGAGAAGKVSLQEKRSFAKSLYSISKEDLGKILVEVESKCPAALTRNAAEDEVEVNVDKISPAVLQELQLFVSTARSNNKKQKKAAPGGGGGAGPAGGGPAGAGGGGTQKKQKVGGDNPK